MFLRTVWPPVDPGTIQPNIKNTFTLNFIKIKRHVLNVSAGTSTPPSIAATPVPALPPPIAVNSYPSVPAPPNGQSATEALYTNGVHAYQGTATNYIPRSRKVKINCAAVIKYSSTDSQASSVDVHQGRSN